MKRSLVVFALDAADPELLLRWSADGTLPVLAGLLTRGAHARIAGPECLSAHGVWPSLWSGRSLPQHGRYLRRPLRPGGYDLLGEDEALEPATPFWAGLRSRRIVVLDAPDARLAPGLDGSQLLNWNTHPSRPRPASDPPGHAARLEALVGRRILSDEVQGTRGRDRRVYLELLERVRRQGLMARALLAEGFDLGVIGFADAHAAGHRFWRYSESRTPTADPELRGAVREVYRAIDTELGRILAVAPGDPVVMVVTDHGIREGYPTWDLMQGFCRVLGYQALRDSGTLGATRQGLGRLWHRLRPRLRRGGASPAFGTDTLQATDWPRTRAFAIPSHYTGLIRINLRGREPRGTVEPGGDYQALLDALESDLRQLADAATGEPAVERVTRTGQAFGDAALARLPDLFVDWRPSPLARVVHPRGPLGRRRRFTLPRANLHSRSGLLLVAGDAVRVRGQRGELWPSDLAALALGWLGAEAAPPPSERARRAFAPA